MKPPNRSHGCGLDAGHRLPPAVREDAASLRRTRRAALRGSSLASFAQTRTGRGSGRAARARAAPGAPHSLAAQSPSSARRGQAGTASCPGRADGGGHLPPPPLPGPCPPAGRLHVTHTRRGAAAFTHLLSCPCALLPRCPSSRRRQTPLEKQWRPWVFTRSSQAPLDCSLQALTPALGGHYARQFPNIPILQTGLGFLSLLQMNFSLYSVGGRGPGRRVSSLTLGPACPAVA